jgi:rhamnulokinase
LNFTNEGGVAGTFRLLRNVMGLWLVQGIRRGLAHQGHAADYDDLTRAAAASPALQVVIDPDASAFLRADDMPRAIRDFCDATGQPPPDSPGALVRTALEALALRYRWVVEHLEALTGRSIRTLHVVGGGVRNQLLCQMTADATNRAVLAGPAEATAVGNLVVQLMAAGRVGSLAEGRNLVAQSFPVEEYRPVADSRWEDAYGRFLSVLGHAAVQ